MKPRAWYSMSAIWRNFRRNQMLFVLEHLATLRDGKYPPRPTTGYIDGPGVPIQQSLRADAPFTRNVELAAEVTRRLDACGHDGRLVLRVFADGWEVPKIAQLLHTHENRVWARINRTLRYCRGRDKKEISYQDWIRNGGH